MHIRYIKVEELYRKAKFYVAIFYISDHPDLGSSRIIL